MAYELQDRAFRLLIDDRNVSYVLITLAWYADHDKNQCYPSIDTLARRCHIKRDSVIAAIKVLERYGVLSRKRRYNTSNIYKFSEKFKEVVQKNEDMSIEDFILAEEVKVPGGGLLPIPAEEVKVPGGGLSFAKSKSLEGDSNKVDINNNKVKKEKDIPPIIPLQGESVVDNGLSQNQIKAMDMLSYFRDRLGGKSRDSRPFVTLLANGFTPDDIKLVIDWVASVWRKEPGELSPLNICRKTLFAEKLDKANQWKQKGAVIDAAEVVEAYNNTFGDSLPYAELDRDLERKIHRLADCMKEKNITAFINYFEHFNKHAPDFYFGNNNTGWRADIDFLLKPETLRKTRNFP
ncbi:helix-turn-helix domain-containing protein [Escherichia coli]|uniref:helix-turn-helix domain-containing protein n=1 Tax=Escherichia coli TaxID=562 RepID=UPI0023EE04CF|nr:helix-turn-helix domain-containing protein [Escherichia coli]